MENNTIIYEYYKLLLYNTTLDKKTIINEEIKRLDNLLQEIKLLQYIADITYSIKINYYNQINFQPPEIIKIDKILQSIVIKYNISGILVDKNTYIQTTKEIEREHCIISGLMNVINIMKQFYKFEFIKSSNLYINLLQIINEHKAIMIKLCDYLNKETSIALIEAKIAYLLNEIYFSYEMG